MNFEQKAKKYKIKYLKLKKEIEDKYGKSIEELYEIYGGNIDRLRQNQQLTLDQYNLSYDKIKEKEDEEAEEDTAAQVKDMINKLSSYKKKQRIAVDKFDLAAI